MNDPASGWCPKHDRVFTKANRCPECGTPLVPVGAAPKPAHPEEHRSGVDQEAADPRTPVARNRWLIRSILAAALPAAFVLGLAFPRSEPGKDPSPVRAAPRELFPIQRQAGASGGEIRLERFTQSGDRITASFRTVTGFADPSLIEGAAVEVTADVGGSEQSSFGVSDAHLVADAKGFTVTGRLDGPGRVLELRIISIQVQAAQALEWSADISPIWPVGPDAEPKALRVKQPSRPVEGGSVRLTAFLAWTDRLEAVLELRGLGSAAGNRSEIVGLELALTSAGATGPSVGERTIEAVQLDQVSAGQMIARFESVPSGAGAITLRATRVLNFVAGPWRWRLS